MRNVLNQKQMFLWWLLLAVTFVVAELIINAINIDFFGKPANWYSFLYQPLTYLLWILVLPLVFLVQRRIDQQQNMTRFYLKHILAGLMICTLHRLVVELLLVGLLGALDPEHAQRIHPLLNPDVFMFRILTGGLSNLFLYVISLVIVMLLDSQNQLQSELERRFQAERDRTLAELRALKMQFSPHFLLNALNGAVALVEKQREEACDYLLSLGDMLKYTLAQQHSDSVPLRSEVDFVRNYLQVQEMRFGARLKVSLAFSDDALEVNVPPLLCQPLIENAIKHGLEGGSQPCQVHFRGFLQVQGLVLEVENSVQRQATSDDRQGTGLDNLRERLKLHYGDQAKLQTGMQGKRFVARIEVSHA